MNAPFPATPEQIRAEFRLGLIIEWCCTEGDGVSWLRWEVVAADAESCTLRFTPLDKDGEPTGDTRERPASWVDLRNHATFDADRTTLEDADLETPWGVEPCLLYTIQPGPDDKESEVKRLWFGKNRQGAPLRFETQVDGEVTFENVQIKREQKA